jgi:hypothetical protein
VNFKPNILIILDYFSVFGHGNKFGLIMKPKYFKDRGFQARKRTLARTRHNTGSVQGDISVALVLLFFPDV